MGRFRAHSPTPSAGSDAIPELLQEGEDLVKRQIPPGVSVADQPAGPNTTTGGSSDKKVENWVIFVGNIHPRTTRIELREVIGGPDEVIRSIIIRNTRGCGVTVIPDEAMVPSDRCYATVEFKAVGPAWELVQKYKKEPAPILHGLPITFELSPADMPDVHEILTRTGLLPPDPKPRFANRQPRKRITKKGPVLAIEDAPKPLAGPSRGGAQPKSRAGPYKKSAQTKSRKKAAGGARSKAS